MNEKHCGLCQTLLPLDQFYPINARGELVRYEKFCKSCKKSRRRRGNACIEPHTSCSNHNPALNRKEEKKLDYSLWETLKGDTLSDNEKFSIEINLKTLIEILSEERFRQTGKSIGLKTYKYNFRP